MENLKFEFRAVIKFLRKEGRAAKEIHDRLCAVYGDSAPFYTTVTRWSNEFQRKRELLEDDPRSSRLSDTVNPSIIAAVEKLIRDDRRIKVLEIARTMQISCGSVKTIIYDHLKMSKVSAKWVPRNLTNHDRARRVTTSQEIVDALESDPVKFVQQIVTGDETWVHHWDPESKVESRQWRHASSPPPRKFRTLPSAGKLMVTIFGTVKDY